MTTVRDRLTVLDSGINELAERLARLAAKEAELEAQVADTRRRLARGTEPQVVAPEVTRPRARRETIAPKAPRDLHVDVLEALATEPGDAAGVAKRLRVPVGRVALALRNLRKAKRVFNLGSDVAPAWMPVVGDEAPTTVLYAAVERMLSTRPMTFAELTAATGARRGRLSGVIVQMQRSGRAIANRGTERRARWMLLPKK